MQRIAVIGATSSGKSTLAGQLAAGLDMPHVELDAIHWQPGWQELPRDQFRERTVRALAVDRWVCDGNYSPVRDIVWNRADTVIWLDYPLIVVLGRLLRRTLRRVLTREVLWGTNRESLRALVGRDSLLVWLFKSHPRHRKRYPALFAQSEYAHLRVVHLHSPAETRRWLNTLLNTDTDHD